LKPDIGTE